MVGFTFVLSEKKIMYWVSVCCRLKLLLSYSNLLIQIKVKSKNDVRLRENDNCIR